MNINKKYFVNAVLAISVALVFLTPVTAFANNEINEIENQDSNDGRDIGFDEISAYRCWTESGGNRILNNGEDTESQSTTLDYPIGETIWQYQITGSSYDFSIKAIASIPDINDDGIDDVIVCSEDYYVRCFDGSAIGTGVVLWEHEIYSGSLWCQNELTITEDVNNDGYNDVVVGTTGGDRSVHTLSGKTGATIWTHDTHEYGGGGWVYQVDCTYDYNDDGVIDVLATTGGLSDGPRRVYCLDGEDGAKIWECPLGNPRGPGFSVIGIEDFTGDGQPDVLAGASDVYESVGYAYGINGATGGIIWSFITPGSSVWALEQIDDITSDGIKDVIIGDFSGNIYGLDATTGSMEYSNTLGGYAIITRFEKINDVNGDGHPDIIPAHSTLHVTQVIDGYTGSLVWSHPTADQPWNVARISDISGDGIDDVIVGTLFQSNYCYFLNGVDGSELAVVPYEVVDAIAAISDVTDDGSMEMVAGGRYGLATCFSGGLDSSHNPVEITADFTADTTEGTVPLLVNFTDLSIAENTIITSWRWDFETDGIIDSEEQNPSWTYTEAGLYTVSLTVSDGAYSDTETKDDYITVLPAGSILEIGNVTGGLFKISTEVKNIGDTEVTDVNWNITIDGMLLLGKESNGTILDIDPKGAATIKSRLILGLGKVTITITANANGAIATKTVNGVVLLFFIIIPS